jgi:hypothetical protein
MVFGACKVIDRGMCLTVQWVFGREREERVFSDLGGWVGLAGLVGG